MRCERHEIRSARQADFETGHFMKKIKTLFKSMLPTSVAQQIRRLLLNLKLRNFQARTVEHLYLGHRLKVSIRDGLAEGWYDHDWKAMPEVEFLKRGRLKTGATVFDIGAHQCLVAMVLAKVVGESGLVVAVEGTRHNAEVAVENCRINCLANVQVKHSVAEHHGL